MTKRENLDDPGSCLNRAADDEPIFVLKATDPSAPMLILDWAARYLMDKMLTGGMPSSSLPKFLNAIKVAEQMREWRARWVIARNKKEDVK